MTPKKKEAPRKAKRETAKCVRATLFDRPLILCFEGEEILMNKAAKRYLKEKKRG